MDFWIVETSRMLKNKSFANHASASLTQEPADLARRYWAIDRPLGERYNYVKSILCSRHSRFLARERGH